MKTSLTILMTITALILVGCGKSHPDRDTREVRNAPASHSSDSRQPSGKGGIRKTGKPYQVGGHWYYPLESAEGYNKTGTASWYGSKFHGRKTANGERYDMHAMSAAHTTLPMPTMVRVTNLDNGRSVVVRVNDRGPFVKNRIIDLSYAAARELGYDQAGTARVRVEALGHSASYDRRKPPQENSIKPAASTAGGGMYIQLGAFSTHSNALRLKNTLVNEYPSINIYSRNGGYSEIYRVRIGPFDNVRSIESNVLSLQRQGYANAIVVIE